MQINHKFNRSLITFGLMILLFISQSAQAATPGVQFDYFGTGRSNFLMLNFDEQIRWDILGNPALPLAQTRRVYWGISSPAAGIFDNPVFGDYDGDGKNDIGVWRAGNAQNPQSYFYIQLLTNPNPNAILGQAWGLPDDFPYSAGDFDGDGKDDFAVFRPDNSTFYWLRSSDGGFGAQYRDGDSAVSPAGSANLFENATGSHGKSIPAATLKSSAITKQPDGTFRAKRAVDFFCQRNETSIITGRRQISSSRIFLMQSEE